MFTTRLSGGKGGRNGYETLLDALHITQNNSRPNHPATCSKVERLHQTLKRWLAAHPAATIDELQAALDHFVHEYNQQRSHSSLTAKSIRTSGRLSSRNVSRWGFNSGVGGGLPAITPPRWKHRWAGALVLPGQDLYILLVIVGYTEAPVTKTLIDIDDDALDRAQRALRTTTKKDTVNEALAVVAALSARRRDLERFAADAHADLRDADIMSRAWQR